MSKVTLPRTNQTGANEWADVEANDVALAEKINGGLDNENIASGANIARSKLEGGAQGVAGQWYAPVAISTEQTRESTSLGVLSTPDEITGVVLPTNGLICAGYTAMFKSSVSEAGRAAIFLGSNQLKVDAGEGSPNLQAAVASTNWRHLSTGAIGLSWTTATYSGDVTTGQALAASNTGVGGVCAIFAAAGTYAVSVRYSATSGSVTAKNRTLWVYVLGV